MIVFRLLLLAGLLYHKGVWIAMRRRALPCEPSSAGSPSLPARLAKCVKVAILVLIIVQVFLPDVLPILDRALVLRIVGACAYALGLTVAVLGRIQLGGNWSDIEVGRVAEGHEVVSTGVYRYLRHPIYVGDLLLLIGLELALNSWLVLAAVALVPPVLWRAVKEERALCRAIPGYAEYARRSKRFVPFIV